MKTSNIISPPHSASSETVTLLRRLLLLAATHIVFFPGHGRSKILRNLTQIDVYFHMHGKDKGTLTNISCCVLSTFNLLGWFLHLQFSLCQVLQAVPDEPNGAVLGLFALPELVNAAVLGRPDGEELLLGAAAQQLDLLHQGGGSSIAAAGR